MFRNTVKTQAGHVIPFIRANCGPIQQDNASPLVVWDNTDYLRHNNIDVLPWPDLSPDLSLIEHLWDQLDRTVATDVGSVTCCLDATVAAYSISVI